MPEMPTATTFGYVADGPAIHYNEEGKAVKTYMFSMGVLEE